MKKFILSLVMLFSATANAAIINISSETGLIETLNLGPGNYLVEVIGTDDGGLYDAWNAWGRVRGCDSSDICSNGFINNYYIESDELGRSLFSDRVRYRTADLALSNAVGTQFTLFNDGEVKFYINDSNFTDNLGGISLRVTYVPAPTVIGIMGLALMTLSLVRRRAVK